MSENLRGDWLKLYTAGHRCCQVNSDRLQFQKIHIHFIAYKHGIVFIQLLHYEMKLQNITSAKEVL